VAAVTRGTTADEPVTALAQRPAPEVVRAETLVASRSRIRVQAPVPSPARPKEKPALQLHPRWTTTRLNVWSGPGEHSRLLTVLDAAVKVQVTGTVRGPWAQIQHKDRTAWARKAYLVRDKPSQTVSAPPAGVSGAPCHDGSSVENGLQPNTVKLYRAVCAAFPAVSAWGGLSGSGDHGAGRALDIMCTGSLGDAIASYVRSHAAQLGVSEVIWEQHIWTVQRSSEGWRLMEDRGSATANHYDHVHVSVY
jgi:Bacterial SH3 domain